MRRCRDLLGFLIIVMALSPSRAESATITLTTTWTSGQVLTASALNTNFTDVTAQVNNNLDNANLAPSITMADGDLFSFASVNMSSATEGLIIGQSASCASATAEGQICFDTDDDNLVLGTGSSTVTFVKTSGTTDLNLSGNGTDLRMTPTGGDAIHFGAEYAAATGTIGMISNATDGKLYIVFRNDHLMEFPQYLNCGSLKTGADGKVLCGPVTMPGGSSSQVQYNNSGSFGGTSGLTVNATTVTDLTFASNAIASSDLTTGLSDEQGSGAAVFATSPTFTTSLVSPLVIGGTSTTADLSLQTTSGVGASGADMHFLVGNNGATEAMTILNSGNVGIGTTSPGALLEVAGDLLLSGTGPDIRWNPTGGDSIHAGAEFAAGTGTIWTFSNVTDGKHYLTIRNDHLFEFGQYNCSALKNGGKLTATVGNKLICQPDIGDVLFSSRAIVEESSDTTTTSTSFVLLTGMAQTVTLVNANPVQVWFRGSVFSNTDSADVNLTVFVDGVNDCPAEGCLWIDMTGGTQLPHNVSFSHQTDPLSVGIHTVQIYWKTSTGTAAMQAGAGDPGYEMNMLEVAD